MILRFAATNYRCFRERAELNFLSTRQRDEPAFRLPFRAAEHGVLPVLGLFGANASGKSTMLSAIAELSSMVANSFLAVRPSAQIPWTPWRMRADDASPTTLEIEFTLDETRYWYGISFTATRYTREWLHAWGVGGRAHVLFERDISGPGWYFGAKLGGRLRQIREATRDNALFLSAAAQHNHPRLRPVADVLGGRVVVGDDLPPDGYPLFAHDSVFCKDEAQDGLAQVLRRADLGVVGFTVREPGPLGDDVVVRMRELLNDGAFERLFGAGAPTEGTRELHLRHAGEEGSEWDLPPRWESLGTKVFMTRLADVLQVLGKGGFWVMDELDRSLHPDLVAALIGLFTSEATNPRGAQMVFSSHQRELMYALRRDEIVLFDKDSVGASSVTSVADFRDLRARDDVVRAHRQGRIRGTAALGSIERAVADLVRLA